MTKWKNKKKIQQNTRGTREQQQKQKLDMRLNAKSNKKKHVEKGKWCCQ
jgi:hypothetical protein